MTGDQERVKMFVQKHGLNASVENRLLDLLSEAGELAKEALKGNRYGQTAFSATKNWRVELGDVYFSLLCLANLTDVDLSQALSDTLLKYEQRISLTSDPGSGK
jgi:NTP pyrophosphatase (non-canonical NTP hydrolase)